MDEISMGQLCYDADLTKKIEMADVISFDFFDTLYLRPLSDPEDAFTLLGEKLKIENFRVKRQQAQAEAFKIMAQEGRKEITLENIYHCFPDCQYAKEVLMQAEYDLEMQLIEPNYELFPLFQQLIALGKQVVIVSDMYFSGRFFEQALAKQKIENVPIFSSADANATKRDSGELFTLVSKQLGVAPGKILHIGDSEIGDVKRPAEKGLQSYHYVASRFRDKKKNISLSTSLSEGLLRLEAREIEYGSYEELGFLTGGPASLGFLEWIKSKSHADGIDHILFFARDGYVLTNVANQYMQDLLPPFNYFYGSRTTFTLAAMTDSNFSTYIPFLISGSDGLAASEVLERIGAKVPAPEIMNAFGLGENIVITPALHDKLVTFLYAWRWEILKVCQRNRRALFQYLRQSGIKNHQKIAVVDVGWSGTTQEAFTNAINAFMKVDIYGYYFCLADTPERLHRQNSMNMSALFDSSNSSADLIAKIYAARVAIEFFFSAPHNSIIGLLPGEPVVAVEDAGRGADENLSDCVKALCYGSERFAQLYYSLQEKIGLQLNPQMLAMPMIELANTDNWEKYSLITCLKNFDAWGSSRNKQLLATDYLSV
jgi:predicted HAD superfamily hydrolase